MKAYGWLRPLGDGTGFFASITLVSLSALIAVGCSSVGDTSLSPEGEIGAGALDGDSEGAGAASAGDTPTPEAAACGDGACDPGENVFTCRADCEAGPFLQCLTEACPEAVQGCSESSACANALICLSACDPDADFEAASACRSACAADLGESDAAAFAQVATCEADSGCRPDGPSDGASPEENPETDPALSCEGRCGSPMTDDLACACDASCAIFGDCCDDYEALCVDPPPTGADLSLIHI